MNITDRVKLNDEGRRLLPLRPDRIGTVESLTPTESAARVLWDGLKTVETIHRSFLEVVDS